MSSAPKQKPGFLEDYIPVIDRIGEFYEEYPEGRIVTELLSYEAGFAMVKASVYRNADDAQPAATGHSSDSNKDFTIERAETGSVGRALMMLGYETKRGPKPERPRWQQECASLWSQLRRADHPSFSDSTKMLAHLIDTAHAKKWPYQKVEGLASVNEKHLEEYAKLLGDLLAASQS